MHYFYIHAEEGRVENDKLRAPGEGESDAELPLLTGGELPGPVTVAIVEPDGLQDGVVSLYVF